MSELTKKTIYEHAEALRKKEYSSVQLTQAYLDRIAAKDKTIGAYITVTAEKALEKFIKSCRELAQESGN